MGLIVSVCAQATWQHVERWIKVRQSMHVDQMYFVPPDHDQTHVLNSETSITLVKPNGCDLIPASTNAIVALG